MKWKEYIVWFCMIFFCSSLKVYAGEMQDIDNHWANIMIQDAITDGWVNGYEDHLFKPENFVTRMEFLKMLIASSNDYLIVTGGNLYPNSYIETAKERGLLENENIEDTMTRNDVCHVLSKYIDLSDVKPAKNSFIDLYDEESEEILKLKNLGIISGYEDNTFRKDNKVTRAEAIVLLQRAIQAKKERSFVREYDLLKSTHYTNYSGHEKIGSSYDDYSYKINKGKLFIIEEKENQQVDTYEVKSDFFDVPKAIKVIQNLVNEVGYVGVKYFTSETIPNQLIIAYGQNEKRVSNQTNEITITYYQNQYENLREKSRVDVFSENCYMKISIVYLWQDLHEFQNQNYVDEFLKKRLEKALEGEFGEKYAPQVTTYITCKIEEMFLREDHYDAEIGQKKIGKYQIDYYKAENDIPEFYISKSI